MTRSYTKWHMGKAQRFGAILTSALLVGGAAAGVIGSSVGQAGADSLSPINFESGYTNGSVNGQNGWSSTGSYDQAVVNTSSYPGAPASFGNKSLRMSNAVVSGSFGDQTYSPPTANAAGESGADAGGYPVGTMQPDFTASFDFASTTPSVEQPGLYTSISPDRGDGARMSYVRIEDSPSGFNLFFDDYVDIAPLGSSGNLDNGCQADGDGDGVSADGFREVEIATGISRTAHNLEFKMQFVPGPHNDVVQVLLDGNVIETGTSWEDYYRYCAESGGGTGGPLADQSRITRDLEFREGGDTNTPSVAGQGFLFDNVDLASGAIPNTPMPVSGVPGNKSVTVTWKAPAVNAGGAPITGYVVTPYIGATAQPARTFNSTKTTEAITGLHNSTGYTFRIAATNAIGTGAQGSATGNITAGAPGKPSKPTVTKTASGTLKVAFKAPGNNGAAITSYTATCSATGGVTKSKSRSASPIGIAGLTAGKSYVCRVTAMNSRGTGTRSDPSTPVTA